MTWGVGRQDPNDEDGVVLVSVPGPESAAVLGFESEQDARDFIVIACTNLEMGQADEWTVLSLDEYEGPIILVMD